VAPYHIVTRTVDGLRCFPCKEENDRLLAELGLASGKGKGKKGRKRSSGGKPKKGVRKLQRDIVRIFGEVLLLAVQRYEVELRHFVLMSNHYHMVVQTRLGNIDKFMQFFNGVVAQRVNRLLGRTGHLWGQRYHSSIIDTERYMFNVVRYIYQNPPKAGLVVDPLDYGLGTVSFYAFGRPAFVEVTEDGWFVSLGETEEERRQRFIREVLAAPLSDEEREEIRQGLRRRVYGRPEFAEAILSACVPDWGGGGGGVSGACSRV
jgi:REP element-mobilizing transposase RayT